ncbi:protein polybromo-1 isoform X3 [Aethina tumida]|uniref:protein polybromo-1 isoform X3 n=1 Tax=Aethina tumida TaxID=116153 RepID=UPI0021495CC7|nr:protein polybromo-1 isoform X3 [Aethina tumida]
MSKRRRTSSIASRNHEDDSLDSVEASTSSGPTMRKRRKLQDPAELCHQLYDTIRNHKKNDGTLLCDLFIRVPKRRQEPGYYDVVSNPMDLLKVQQKLKTDEYIDLDDLQSDIELIVNNTKAFYKRNTQEYKDAVELWDLFITSKSRLLNGKDEEETRSTRTPNNRNRQPKRTPVRENHRNDVNDHNDNSRVNDVEQDEFEQLYRAVTTAVDSDKKPLHTFFQVLPSKKRYPDYYEVVETPIDLRMVADKMHHKKYNLLVEMERDLLLMTKNACLYNEPGSQIFKHAKALRKVIQMKRIEIEDQPKATPAKMTGRRSVNSNNVTPKLTRSRGSTPVIKNDDKKNDIDHDDLDDTIDDDGTAIDSSNPLWQLFDSVKSVTSSNGVPLSEPFWRLPSRRFYPDYYREIKNPVSLTQIKRKLVKSAYGNLSEVAGDLTIMFENAKKYNIPTSKLYKDAVKLQKIMQCKVQELLDIDQGSDSDLEDKIIVPVRKKPGPKPKNSFNPNSPGRGRPPKDSIPLKKRLHALGKYMLEFTCEDGRKPMLAFMQKPSKKLYSDYYDVIAEPIDFLEIESKIRADQYSCELDLVKDFKLMFSNCRQYNEENSTIYDDSLMLEKHLMDKVGHLFTTPEKDRKDRRVYKARTKHQISPLERNMKTLYESIRDYKEPKSSRQLSQIFMKLPSKIEYPDYYEVIQKPIDMDRISHKMKTNQYETLEDLVADFVLMFDNACKYNEPDSQIYKDALMLQRVCMQTKLLLKEEDNTVPDVASAIQDILLTLFTTVYNHQDEEGRCYSDSMAELPEHDEIENKKVRALSLDLLKRRLDKGVYRRLDTFQEDFFACMERARRLSRTDSQIFEDSVELQKYFIHQRNEICKGGELLLSSALSYTLNDATAAIETLRHSKHLQESVEDETETRSSDDSIIKDGNADASGPNSSMTCNQQTYKVGEFVYVDSKEKGCDPHILMIERLWENKGQQMLYGNYYLRPAETYHVTTRKFLEREVFKSDSHVAVPLEEVKDRCCVMNVKHYFTMRPEGYDEKDVYVCESRYSTRTRSFKKIKIYPENATVKLVPREEPLEPKRVVSVFRERVEKHMDELAELEEQEQLVEKEKPNVVAYTHMEIDDGNTYYEQFNTICSGVVKTGDFVYVAADGGKQLIAQIDSIWDTKDGKSYFRGPWFVPPSELPQSQNKLFYKQEMFLSSLEDTNPVVSIMGRCAVLDYNDYISCRPTEIAEADTFICTSMYDEVNRQIRKLPNDSLRKYSHSGEVTEDEIYFFPKLINPPKESTHLTKMNDMDIIMEDSMDGGPPSVGSGEIPTTVISNTPVTPAASKKKPNKNKIVTGYILYSREVRKQVVQNNPESTFGDISRIVGSEWKSLPASEKQSWEERASKINEETKAQMLDEQCSSPAPTPTSLGSGMVDQIFECCWDNCDYQFEECSDLIEHCVKDKDTQGHVQAYFQENPGADLHCQWRNCLRNNKKDVKPFPNIARLIRHVRDMHINKGNGRSVAPENRSKNYVGNRVMPVLQPCVSTTSEILSAATSTFNTTAGTYSTTTNTASGAAQSNQTQQQNQEPMFITVPPRPQRVLHSEAYIKYIEGLQAENKYITQWERTLNATQENSPAPDLEKLNNVTTWLGRKADQHDNVVAAIWALRNQLLRDTLGLHKTL